MNPNDDRVEPVGLEPTESNGTETKQAPSTSTRTGILPDYLNALQGEFKTFREGLSSSLASSIDPEAFSKVMQSVNGLESKLTVRANEFKSACIASITSSMESDLGPCETIF